MGDGTAKGACPLERRLRSQSPGENSFTIARFDHVVLTVISDCGYGDRYGSPSEAWRRLIPSSEASPT